jgi:hypothetical protein
MSDHAQLPQELQYKPSPAPVGVQKCLQALVTLGGSATAEQVWEMRGRQVSLQNVQERLQTAWKRGEVDRNRANTQDLFTYTATFATRVKYGGVPSDAPDR